MTMPVISRDEQIKEANDRFAGKALKEVKTDGVLIIVEFETGGMLVFANPQAIALGVPKDEV